MDDRGFMDQVVAQALTLYGKMAGLKRKAAAVMQANKVRPFVPAAGALVPIAGAGTGSASITP